MKGSSCAKMPLSGQAFRIAAKGPQPPGGGCGPGDHSAARHRMQTGMPHGKDKGQPARERDATSYGAARQLRGRNPAEEGEGSGAAAGIHVLIVEDDDPVRDHAVRVVRSLGYRVREARSGPEALHLLSQDLRCDLLLTDVVMPGMSGGQLAQAVRVLIPSVPVVFVTGHNSDADVEQLRREGGALLLPKPYRRQALADALRAALRGP